MTTTLSPGDNRASTLADESSVLLGDEAVARGAIDAGITAAYGYPGTPSTEILEYLLDHAARTGRPRASWCTNEKTAYEQALGVSMAGKRALVTMKHVGLNVAADPFINSAITSLDGGFVVAVADDPGMHSSQNEQDSRFYADFAHTLCLEPADQQEAYDMTREAFDLSERFHVPVVLRLVTRLAHSRAPLRTRAAREENALRQERHKDRWILLPSYARRLWHDLLARQQEMRAYTETCAYNLLTPGESGGELGVITTGIARNYFLENVAELGSEPLHLHIGAYPLPVDKIRALLGKVRTLLVLEEGYPFLERQLRGVLPAPVEIRGKASGHIPHEGELSPDVVRVALGLPQRRKVDYPDFLLPGRPPQLCHGCPHADAYAALSKALEGFADPLVTSDIGCYTLGVLPPYSIGESCVCMGASIGMAKGAAEAGAHPAVAVIGDSTFLHSGITALIDAVAADTDMTVIVLDNQAVAMTGSQPTAAPSSTLIEVIRGLGVPPAHFHVLEAHPHRIDQMAVVIRAEIEHRGLSVIVSARECLEHAKRRRAAARQA